MKRRGRKGTRFERWCLKWRSENSLDGRCEYLMVHDGGEGLLLFDTRAKARAFRLEQYGYMTKRPELRKEPFGWRFPAIVRVSVVIAERAT